MPADVPAGCEAVAAALARLDARPSLVARIEVERGRPPDGIYRLELRRDGTRERWLLDGRALRERTVDARASEVLGLAPEGGCERGADGPGTVELHYDAYAERGQSRVSLRVDTASGLPLGARRDAPELAWGRALSRPTKPPQPQLRPTGARLVERIDFDDPTPRR
jgi:hypothetical protein